VAEDVLYTNEAGLAGANVLQTSLALSFLRLFDETLNPTSTTTQAMLEAAETTLVGYPAGGYPITAFNEPIANESGGYAILAPLVQPVYASGSPVTIGGYWIEDAGGKVRQVVKYTPKKELAAVGDGFPIVAQIGYGGPNQV